MPGPAGAYGPGNKAELKWSVGISMTPTLLTCRRQWSQREVLSHQEKGTDLGPHLPQLWVRWVMFYTYHHACVHIGTMDSLLVYNISARAYSIAILHVTVAATLSSTIKVCRYVSKIICDSPGQKTTTYCFKVLYHWISIKGKEHTCRCSST